MSRKIIASVSLLAAGAIAFTFNASSLAAKKPEPADHGMQKVLDEHASLNPKPIETLSPAEARMQPTIADAANNILAREKVKGKMADLINSRVESKDLEIDGAAGKIMARLYRPKGKENEKLPLVVYYSGGGFVIGGVKVYDATPRAMSSMTGAAFLSVEYRKAPENKFPAAHDDAFAAYQWALNNSAQLGINPNKIAVMGESAGGNLAVNVSIMARDKGVKLPIYQVVVYPVAGNDMNTASYQKNEMAKPLNKAMMGWFVKHYTRTPADAQDTRLNLLAANLKGLPSTTLITAEIDPLRSEGKGLAEKLKDAGVEVNYKDYEGAAHEFFGLGVLVKESVAAQSVVNKDLRMSFMKK